MTELNTKEVDNLFSLEQQTEDKEKAGEEIEERYAEILKNIVVRYNLDDVLGEEDINSKEKK